MCPAQVSIGVQLFLSMFHQSYRCYKFQVLSIITIRTNRCYRFPVLTSSIRTHKESWRQCYKISVLLFFCKTDIFSILLYYFNVIKLRISVKQIISPYFHILFRYFCILFCGDLRIYFILRKYGKNSVLRKYGVVYQWRQVVNCQRL